MINIDAQVSSQNFRVFSKDLFQLHTQKLIVSDFKNNASVTISHQEACDLPMLYTYRLRVN